MTYAARLYRGAVAGGRPREMRVLEGGFFLTEVGGDTGQRGGAAAMSDAALVRRVQSGDLDAFEPLYRRHVGAVYAVCLRLAADRERAAELVQDVFVRAWEVIGSFRGESAFPTWLHRLAVNVVLQEFRSTGRRLARITHLPAVGELEVAAPSRSSDDRLDLEAALATLPPGARAAFVLHEIEGYSHSEIASFLGLATGTLRAQLWRARQLLMEALSR